MADHDLAEVWLPVKGWPDYEISDQGRLRRATSQRGATKGQILKAGVATRGYKLANLRSRGRRKTVPIHRLVCEAFHGPQPDDKPVVAHWDGNPLNNFASNLRWADHSENAYDALRHGTMRSGVQSHATIYSDARRRAICRARKLGLTYAQLSERFGVSQMTAWNFVNGRGPSE